MKKKILVSLLVFFTLGFLITGCKNNNSEPSVKTGNTTFDSAAMRKVIDEKNNEFAKAFISGDSITMINHYTSDAKLFPPNSAVVIGRNAISDLVQQYLKYGIKEFKDETMAVYGNGDDVIEEGTLFMGDGKGNTIDRGKYICVWRKVNDGWKVFSNMWNTSLPATPSK